MWIPIVLIGGGVAWYFLTQYKPAAPVAQRPAGIPGLPGILPAGLVAPAAKPAAAAPAGPADNGPYFQAYWANMNNAADDYNSGKLTQDNFYALELGYWQNAQGDFASGNISKNDMATIQATMQQWSVI
jgi:hypothetical protein